MLAKVIAPIAVSIERRVRGSRAFPEPLQPRRAATWLVVRDRLSRRVGGEQAVACDSPPRVTESSVAGNPQVQPIADGESVRERPSLTVRRAHGIPRRGGPRFHLTIEVISNENHQAIPNDDRC